MDTELDFLEIPGDCMYLSEEEDGSLFTGEKVSPDSQALFDFSEFLDTPSPAASPLIHPKRKQPAGAAAGASAASAATDNFEILMSELMNSDASSTSAAAPFVFSDQDASNDGFASLLPPPPPPSPRQTDHIESFKCFSGGRIDSALLAQAMSKFTFNKKALDSVCVNLVEVCSVLTARA